MNESCGFKWRDLFRRRSGEDSATSDNIRESRESRKPRIASGLSRRTVLQGAAVVVGDPRTTADNLASTVVNAAGESAIVRAAGFLSPFAKLTFLLKVDREGRESRDPRIMEEL